MGTGRRWLALAIGVLVVWPLAGPAPAASKTVLLKGTQFEPKTVQINAGDTVVWRYESGQRHSVQFEGGPEIGCTGLLQTDCLDRAGEERSRTFSQPGDYAYYCTFHGGSGGQGMSGVVKVTATGTSAESPVVTVSTRPTSSTTTTRPSTTTTTRPLTTSSTVERSTTTTATLLPTTTIAPREPPPFNPGDGSDGSDGSVESGESDLGGPSGEAAASRKDKGRDSSAVALIVGLLLIVSAGGGFLLWRLRPGRGAPTGS
jgi:plastocyanin